MVSKTATQVTRARSRVLFGCCLRARCVLWLVLPAGALALLLSCYTLSLRHCGPQCACQALSAALLCLQNTFIQPVSCFLYKYTAHRMRLIARSVQLECIDEQGSGTPKACRHTTFV